MINWLSSLWIEITTKRKSRVCSGVTYALHEKAIKTTMHIQKRKINRVHLKAVAFHLSKSPGQVGQAILYIAYISKKQLIIKNVCLSTKQVMNNSIMSHNPGKTRH